MTRERVAKLRRGAIAVTAILSVGLWAASFVDLHIRDKFIGGLIMVAVIACGASFWTAIILTIRMRKMNVPR